MTSTRRALSLRLSLRKRSSLQSRHLDAGSVKIDPSIDLDLAA